MLNHKPNVSLEQPWNNSKNKPYIHIDHVVKKFGNFTAVQDVSLSIYKGELFSLLGGSGCGKTTLLRMLAGFEEPTSGKIYIDGVDMAGIAPYDRPTNMMFQSYALFPHMSVENNIAFGLRQDSVPAAEITKRVSDILELVQLKPFAKRKPHQLSGGQRQRVALARALVKQPKLLLLDEPLGALDKKLREQTQFELMNIQSQLGVTFIVVTHDQEEAMTLSTRIGVMNSGQIVQTGTPQEIYEYPTNKFVANFIGSINMFEGFIIEDEPDHVLIKSEQAGSHLYINHGISSPPTGKVFYAIRPEKIILTKDKPDQPYNCLSGIIEEIAYMGNLSVYLIRLPNNTTFKATMPNQIRFLEEQLKHEDRIYASWNASSGIVLLS
ncbi:MAG: ABC transporter ATP-binding protein [Alphaproteobacteria bacterium]|nr:ABC transporter ATP-binding protein [Alphaproteobacteria bacterium]